MPETQSGAAGPPAPLRLARLIAALSVATDVGTGRPVEHGLRTCLLSQELARRSGVAEDQRTELYYVALLRSLGGTADAAEAAEPGGGGGIGFSALLGPPNDRLRGPARSAGSGLPPLRRAGRTVRAPADTRYCGAARRLAARLGMGEVVTASLGLVSERRGGGGVPGRCSRARVPAPARVVGVARDVDLWAGFAGIGAAVEVIRRCTGRIYDPAVADAFTNDAAGVLGSVAARDAWSAVLDAEPEPRIRVGAEALTPVLHAFADFADLKSPWLRGHSSAVAALAASAARVSGLAPAEATALRHAGLLHDLGRIGIPSAIWDREGPLSAGEWEKVRLHPYLTERILHRSAALAPLARLAACHHERGDGSGYHRGARYWELSLAEQLLGAADAYQAMTEPRPHRAALAPSCAAAELERECKAGSFQAAPVEAVLRAAGHLARGHPASRPVGLTGREIEVLRLIARGASNRQVAAALVLSPKTVGAHIEHIYAKAGVSTRAGAALFAMEHRLLGPPIRR